MTSISKNVYIDELDDILHKYNNKKHGKIKMKPIDVKDNTYKHNKTIMLAISKLNSIESKISEALINNQISHEHFMTIINEEKNYRDLKVSIRMMKGQEDKKIDID